MPTISVNSATIYYELHGQGQPMVLISGYTCDHNNFLPVLDQLTKQFQVLIFSNRGIGKTTDNNESLSVELMAKDVIELIKILKLTKPHIVGHSMGGTIAQSVATQYGEGISKLVLLATSAKWRTAMLDALYSLLLLRQKEVDFDTLLACTLPWIFSEKFLSNPEKVAFLRKAILSNPHPQSLPDQTRQYAALKNWDGRTQLASITVPTLVGYGLQDLISLPSESEFLAEQIQGAKTVSFDCAHDFTLDVPQELARAIINFCKD